MKIGYFFNGKLYPPKAGGNVHAYQMVKQLTDLGHSLHTIFYDTEDPMVNIYRRKDLLRFVYDLDILYIRIHGSYAQEKLSLLKILRPNLPVIWEINAPLEEGVLVGKSTSVIRSLSRRRKLLANLVNAATCVSEELKDYALNDLGIKDVAVVPNGSDPIMFSPHQKNNVVYKNFGNKFKVLWMGTTHFKWHGVDQIFEIAKRVHDRDLDIQFIIIGNKRDINMPEAITPNIVIYDPIEYLKLPPYVASADVGLCLYYDEEQGVKFYRSPLKLFDYMASGLGVIATALGQIREVIKDGENGFLIEHNNIDRIVEKIIYLKNNPAVLTKVGSGARKSVEDYYNWQRTARETLKVFEKVLK